MTTLDNGRSVNVISERDQVRTRYQMWVGADRPKTIVMKELIDNLVDVIAERKMPATEGWVHISPDRVSVMDNGTGISTELHDDGKTTDLWLAIGKLFTTSNNEGVEETIGANGVGSTVASFTSNSFSAYRVTKDSDSSGEQVCLGYHLDDGNLSVDNVVSYTTLGDLKSKYKMVVDGESGYIVDGYWEPGDVYKDSADIEWLKNYTKLRTAEINSGVIHFSVYSDNEFNTQISYDTWGRGTERFLKKSGIDNPEPNWIERAEASNSIGGNTRNYSGYIFRFFDDIKDATQSMVQGAPVDNRASFTYPFEVNGVKFNTSIPYSFYYRGKEYPNYTDQTKTSIRNPLAYARAVFESQINVYNHFYKVAERAYLKSLEKDGVQSGFWPETGTSENAELIISEGFSASSGVKSQRDPATQACLALIGKFASVWNSKRENALKSDVVTTILNIIESRNYKKIIIATDADPDGSHIRILITALIWKFAPEIIREGKLYSVWTPHYIFTKRGKPYEYSDNASDCPDGYETIVLKGLGGLSPEQVQRFITNEETRVLEHVVTDENDDISNDAFETTVGTGGKKWIK